MEVDYTPEAQAKRAVSLWTEVRKQLLEEFPTDRYVWPAFGMDNVITSLTVALIGKK